MLRLFRGNLDAVRMLVENGADVNQANDEGFTPFLSTAWGSCNLSVFDYLIEKEVDVNAVTARYLFPYELKRLPKYLKGRGVVDSNGLEKRNALSVLVSARDSDAFFHLINNYRDHFTPESRALAIEWVQPQDHNYRWHLSDDYRKEGK